MVEWAHGVRPVQVQLLVLRLICKAFEELTAYYKSNYL